jgi:hypothetical protein
MMEAMRSSETSVLTRATRRNILDEDILHCIFVVIFAHISVWFLQSYCMSGVTNTASTRPYCVQQSTETLFFVMIGKLRMDEVMMVIE